MGVRFRLERGGGGLLFWRLALAVLTAAPLGAQKLHIYHVDVEEGDATLLVAPSGKTLLVDGGSNGQGSGSEDVRGEVPAMFRTDHSKLQGSERAKDQDGAHNGNSLARPQRSYSR